MLRRVVFVTTVMTAAGYKIKLEKTQHTPAEASHWFEQLRKRQSGLAPPRKWGKYNLKGNPIQPLENFSDEVWIGNITVGSPPQGPYPVVLDTGSANLWVPGVKCDSDGCNNKPRFDPAKSSTTVDTGKTFFLPYGTGYCLGSIVNDTVHFAGVSSVRTPCGVADNMAAFFEDEPLAGILGLAFKDISIPPGIPTAFDMLVDNDLIAQDMFSVYLSEHHDASRDSLIEFGGYDSKYIVPGSTISYHKVALPSYWLVAMDNTYVDGNINHACFDGYCPVVMDTGTSVIAAPKGQLSPMIEAIGEVKADCSNVKDLPTISFELGGEMFDLEAEYYVIREVTEQGVECILGMETIPAIEAGPIWIMGDPFLRKYFTIYDRTTDPPRVGIAPAIQS